MSDKLGPVSLLPDDGSYVREISPETERLIDEEVQLIVEHAHADSLILRLHTYRHANLPSWCGRNADLSA